MNTTIETFDTDIIYPVCRFVRQCCHGCGSVEYEWYKLLTSFPGYTMNVCNRESCIEKARKGLYEFIRDCDTYFTLDPIHDSLREINVMRSSGDIETDWNFLGIFYCDGETCIQVIQFTRGLEKTIKKSTFISSNPELENWINDYEEQIRSYHENLLPTCRKEV